MAETTLRDALRWTLNEGWVSVGGSKKQHYVRDGKTLCEMFAYPNREAFYGMPRPVNGSPICAGCEAQAMKTTTTKGA